MTTSEQQRAIEHEQRMIRRAMHREASEAALRGSPEKRLELQRRWLPVLRDRHDHRPVADDLHR